MKPPPKFERLGSKLSHDYLKQAQHDSLEDTKQKLQAVLQGLGHPATQVKEGESQAMANFTQDAVKIDECVKMLRICFQIHGEQDQELSQEKLLDQLTSSTSLRSLFLQLETNVEAIRAENFQLTKEESDVLISAL